MSEVSGEGDGLGLRKGERNASKAVAEPDPVPVRLNPPWPWAVVPFDPVGLGLTDGGDATDADADGSTPLQ